MEYNVGVLFGYALVGCAVLAVLIKAIKNVKGD